MLDLPISRPVLHQVRIDSRSFRLLDLQKWNLPAKWSLLPLQQYPLRLQRVQFQFSVRPLRGSRPQLASPEQHLPLHWKLLLEHHHSLRMQSLLQPSHLVPGMFQHPPEQLQ